MHFVCKCIASVWVCVRVATVSASSIGCSATPQHSPQSLKFSVFYRPDLHSEQLEEHMTILIHHVHPDSVTCGKMTKSLENRKKTLLGGMDAQNDNIFGN